MGPKKGEDDGCSNQDTQHPCKQAIHNVSRALIG